MPISKRKPGKQQRLFGIALAIKRGELSPSYSPEAARIAKATSETKIKKMIKETGKAKKRKTTKRRKKK